MSPAADFGSCGLCPRRAVRMPTDSRAFASSLCLIMAPEGLGAGQKVTFPGGERFHDHHVHTIAVGYLPGADHMRISPERDSCGATLRNVPLGFSHSGHETPRSRVAGEESAILRNRV